jgi:hypothetical protein
MDDGLVLGAELEPSVAPGIQLDLVRNDAGMVDGDAVVEASG